MFKCKVGVPVKVKHLVNDEHFDNAIMACAPYTFKFKLNVFFRIQRADSRRGDRPQFNSASTQRTQQKLQEPNHIVIKGVYRLLLVVYSTVLLLSFIRI